MAKAPLSVPPAAVEELPPSANQAYERHQVPLMVSSLTGIVWHEVEAIPIRDPVTQQLVSHMMC